MRADLSDAGTVDQIVGEIRPDAILHFASLLSAGSESDRARAWQVNMDGAFALFEAAVRHRTRTFLFPSSVASYGSPLPNPVPEDYPQWPLGLYGATKAAVERLGHYYFHKHQLDFRCLRLPIVISPHAHPGAASAYASQAFIESVTAGAFTFRVRPSSQPSLIYAKDVVTAVVRLLDAPASQLSRRIYNVQAMAPTAEQIAAAITARRPEVRIHFQPQSDLVKLIESWPIEFVDRSARRDWGWKPEFDLDTMADDFLDELQQSATGDRQE